MLATCKKQIASAAKGCSAGRLMPDLFSFHPRPGFHLLLFPWAFCTLKQTPGGRSRQHCIIAVNFVRHREVRFSATLFSDRPCRDRGLHSKQNAVHRRDSNWDITGGVWHADGTQWQVIPEGVSASSLQGTIRSTRQNRNQSCNIG